MSSERQDALWSALLVCFCFTLTAEAWIWWHYHLLELTTSQQSDVLTLVCGYLLQAAGIGAAALVVRMRPGAVGRLSLVAAIAAHFACMVPAALGTNLAGTVTFGLLMNVLCGIIAAFYLHALVVCVPKERRAITFSSAYAVSTVITWALSHAPEWLPGGVPSKLVTGVLLSIVAVALVMRAPDAALALGQPGGAEDGGKAAERQADGPDTRPLVTVAALTVFLMSMVKNVGVSLPSSDLLDGVNMETSRLFYAVSLIMAGLVNDRHRSWGAVLCLAALVTPFALLAAANEPISATVLWAVDYLFFGFFSVYRVVLFCDLATEMGEPGLASLGLLFGRLGDALGTGVCLALVGNTMLQVSMAAVLFAATVFLAFHLFRQLYVPSQPTAEAPVRERDEREVFEDFAVRHSISQREREVLRQVLAERTNAEAAAELFVTESTVKYHMRNILRKTGCSNRLELIALYATERGR